MSETRDVTVEEMDAVVKEFRPCSTRCDPCPGWCHSVGASRGKLAAEIVRLRRQVAAMQADTARLDWLEQAAVDPIEVDRYPDRVFLTWGDGGRLAVEATLRAALDAAREATP